MATEEDGVGGIEEEADAEISDAVIEAMFGPADEPIRFADEIANDIHRFGPLAQYWTEWRKKAVLAFRAFPDIDLDDETQKKQVRACQDTVRTWLSVHQWIKDSFIQADIATAEREDEHRPVNPEAQD